MSTEKNQLEANRWRQTALSDLKTAEVLVSGECYAHACFHAQQAAEKALKAVWFFADADPWGHSVQKLIQDLQEVDESLYTSLSPFIPDAAKLDRLYIPTRYPNGLPDLVPEQAFFLGDAETALRMANRIISAASEILT